MATIPITVASFTAREMLHLRALRLLRERCVLCEFFSADEMRRLRFYRRLYREGRLTEG